MADRIPDRREKAMVAWKGIVDRSFGVEGFDAYCRSLQWPNWRPSFVVLHNTFNPTLAMRPNGLTQQNIMNSQSYYRDHRHWSAGPHLFVDDRQIWVFTPLTVPGVHSPSWNGVSLGVEMLGDYQKEAFDGGRGLDVRRNAVAAIAILSEVLALDPDGMRLHREDPKTTHKECPGDNVSKPEFIADVKAYVAANSEGEHVPGAAA
jgi:hypothetical protein